VDLLVAWWLEPRLDNIVRSAVASSLTSPLLTRNVFHAPNPVLPLAL